MSQRPRKKHFRKRHPPVGAKPGTLMINGAAKPPDIKVFADGSAAGGLPAGHPSL